MNDPEKRLKMLQEYFPQVIFTRSNGNQIEEIDNNLDEFMDDKYFLNIPGMAERDIFQPLFPGRELVRQFTGALNNLRQSGKRPNVVVFFIADDDKKFVTELNGHLEGKDKIIPGETLVDLFSAKVLDKCFCQYSLVTKDSGDMVDEFVWDFSDFGFSHSVNSVYNAFYYFSHKNCTLYLFGADFGKFLENPTDWPRIPGEKEQSLPGYLSKFGDISKGLDQRFSNVSAGDFIRKQGASWNEEYSRRYLLELFNLDENSNISLKNIYHSFCTPLLGRKDYSQVPDKKRITAIEYGNDIIDNTLKRNIHLVKGQISEHPTEWNEIINEQLESTPKGTGEYSPVELETFIRQVAGQVNFIRIYVKKEEAREKGTLDHNDRQNINNYMREIQKYVPEEEEESFHKIWEDGNAYKKIKKLYKLMSYENIRSEFGTRYNSIEALYWKAFPFPIEEYRENDEGEPLPNVTIEDRTRPDDTDTAVDLKKLVVNCFEEEFEEDEEEWLRFVREEPAGMLFDDLKAYPPSSRGKLPMATNSNLYRNYCMVMNINNTQARSDLHTPFAHKMRSITNKLEIKLREAGYQRR